MTEEDRRAILKAAERMCEPPAIMHEDGTLESPVIDAQRHAAEDERRRRREPRLEGLSALALLHYLKSRTCEAIADIVLVIAVIAGIVFLAQWVRPAIVWPETHWSPISHVIRE